ncbi:hypothetical protein QOT17_007235 [Balamuthia mandrillaris]
MVAQKKTVAALHSSDQLLALEVKTYHGSTNARNKRAKASQLRQPPTTFLGAQVAMLLFLNLQSFGEISLSCVWTLFLKAEEEEVTRGFYFPRIFLITEEMENSTVEKAMDNFIGSVLPNPSFCLPKAC